MRQPSPGLGEPRFDLHPIQRRYFAEDLVRLRRSEERRRYAAPQRAGRIDANPHQVEAVVFALSRLSEGGCILADEVGLGKTIEAGLVIAQRLAEGATRVLLMAPKPLIGQWRQELSDLFGIATREGKPTTEALAGAGVFVIGREAATSQKGYDALSESRDFNLIVVDEAHEIFGGLHKRFAKKTGEYIPDAKSSRMAGRLYEMLRHTDAPILLLTATPIQNTLTELWSLVQYVDRTGTLLGRLPTFRGLFCADSADRTPVEGQARELRLRLRTVVQRSLRRQAQEFLAQPFVDRQARTFEYPMEEIERDLYEDVTRYLLDPAIAAFQGNQRRLLLLGFHRRMGSSKRALAASLEGVASRLRRMIAGEKVHVPGGASAADKMDAELRALIDDLEDDIEDERRKSPDDTSDSGAAPVHSTEDLKAELGRVESFIARATEMQLDAKLTALLKALQLVMERSEQDAGSGRVVIFTESRVTQDYLCEQLVESGVLSRGEITLFRGTNDSPQAKAALERWRAETQKGIPRSQQPSPDIAVRAALVYEFRTRTKAFISTEAGAKGLNLQFCETVINYDLPWNPQRIEQRIGRCHRYGQKRAVTVINFISKDNEAEKLTYEILSRKLSLFGTILDVSDQVLHRPGRQDAEALVSAIGPEFEAELRRIHERSRTQEEVVLEIRKLRDEIEEKRARFEDTTERTDGLIETHLDEEVRLVFRQRRDDLKVALRELDLDLERVVAAYLTACGINFTREKLERKGSKKPPDESDEAILIDVPPSASLPKDLREGLAIVIGRHDDHPSLHLGHPLIAAALQEAKLATESVAAVAVQLDSTVSPSLQALKGKRARGCLLWVRYDGIEIVDELLPIVVPEGSDEALPLEDARAMLDCRMEAISDGDDVTTVDEEAFEDAVEECLFASGNQLDDYERGAYRKKADQVERYMDDRAILLRRRVAEISARLESAVQNRDSAKGQADRDAAAQRLEKVGQELVEVSSSLDKIEARDGDDYAVLRQTNMQRRYVAPTPLRLFEVELRFE